MGKWVEVKRWKGGITKDHEEALGTEEYICYFNHGDNFMSIRKCKC